MKPKKLNLKKKTIAHLDIEAIKKAVGGIQANYPTYGDQSCDTVCHTFSPGGSKVDCCAGWAC